MKYTEIFEFTGKVFIKSEIAFSRIKEELDCIKKIFLNDQILLCHSKSQFTLTKNNFQQNPVFSKLPQSQHRLPTH